MKYIKAQRGLGLVSTTKRAISKDTFFDSIIPKASGKKTFIRETDDVTDVITEIQKIVPKSSYQTYELSKYLVGVNDYETCKNIWDFINKYIAYAEESDEQLSQPAAAWQNRFTGVDCDCYAIFVSSILTNLKIKHFYRIAEYRNKGYYQHIYVIVPKGNNSDLEERENYIVIDNVVEKFNQEEPFTNKEDFKAMLKIYELSGMENHITDEIANRIHQSSNSMQGTETTTTPPATKQPESNSFMEKAKKNWWVFALIGGGGLLWYFNSKKDSPKKGLSGKQNDKPKVKTKKEIEQENEALKSKLKALKGTQKTANTPKLDGKPKPKTDKEKKK